VLLEYVFSAIRYTASYSKALRVARGRIDMENSYPAIFVVVTGMYDVGVSRETPVMGPYGI
jgi:hypothetical protein